MKVDLSFAEHFLVNRLFIVLREEPVDGVEGEEVRGVDVFDSCTMLGVDKTLADMGERTDPFKADLVGVFRREVTSGRMS